MAKEIFSIAAVFGYYTNRLVGGALLLKFQETDSTDTSQFELWS